MKTLIHKRMKAAPVPGTKCLLFCFFLFPSCFFHATVQHTTGIQRERTAGFPELFQLTLFMSDC